MSLPGPLIEAYQRLNRESFGRELSWSEAEREALCWLRLRRFLREKIR